eukprot:4711147-Amphidinium_carterae.1
MARVLVKLLLRTPPTDHHQPITLEQLLHTDRELCTLLSQSCRSGVKVSERGEYALENALRIARADPFLLSTLQLLPLGVSAAAAAAAAEHNRDA